jgi:hypothetical protein
MDSSTNVSALSVVERIYRLRKHVKASQEQLFDLNRGSATTDVSLNGNDSRPHPCEGWDEEFTDHYWVYRARE